MAQPSSLDLTNDEFLAVFQEGTLDQYAFPHRAHLRLAWLCVRRMGVERSIDEITAGIRTLAGKIGKPGVYHDTMTRAWIYVVAAASVDCPDVATFDQFIDTHPKLLDKSHLLQYYSPQRISSPEARAHWLGPDLLPIPGAPENVEDNAQPDEVLLSLPFAEFRRVLDRVPLPVSIVAAHNSIRVHGTTVSALATVAREPAMLVVCVRPDSGLLTIVRASRLFSVSYLASDQMPIAARFANRVRGEGAEQFAGIPHTLGPNGTPIITGGPAWFECRLVDDVAVGEHRLMCGTVIAAGSSDARPLQRLGESWH